jgi:hypothetical protein
VIRGSKSGRFSQDIQEAKALKTQLDAIAKAERELVSIRTKVAREGTAAAQKEARAAKALTKELEAQRKDYLREGDVSAETRIDRLDRGGDIRRGAAGGHFAHRAIGQADLQKFGHYRSSVWFGRALGQRATHRKSGVERKTGSRRTPRRPEPGGG